MNDDVVIPEIRKVRCIDTDTTYDDIFAALRSTGWVTGVSRLHEACIGKRSTFADHKWEYR